MRLIEFADRSNGWTADRYAAFRVVFGLYLTIHFATIVPWAGEIFSSEGMVPEGAASPLLFGFNLLAWADGPWIVTSLVAAGIAMSVLFAAGWHDRIAAIGLWYVSACLFGRNPLTANPSLAYVGWLLLAHAAVAPSREARDWRLPQPVYLVAWLLLAVGYSYSGATKLSSPSWLDGSALIRILDNPLARDTALRELVLALPESLMKLLTWGALGLELSFAPLAIVGALRPWLWAAALCMHFSLVALVGFADLSVGVVVCHLFTLDPAWWLGGERTQNKGAFS